MSEDNDFKGGIGIAVKMGSELVVATLLGSLIGYTLDHYLETGPWLLVIGVIFGTLAGFLNLYRVAQELNATNYTDKE
jgi:ATP synthase protein I